MAKRVIHIIITISLLLSVSDINRISLLIVASFADNDCEMLFCACSSGCSCSSGHSETPNTNAAGIPLLVPADQISESESSSCCTKPTEDAASDASTDTTEQLIKNNQTTICDCGHEIPESAASILKPLDKVTLFPAASLINSQKPIPCNDYFKLNSYTAHTSEVFHPPSLSLAP